MRSVFHLAAFAGLASAHFNLLNPKSAFFDDDKEGTAPCGGASLNWPSSDSDLFQYHIGGEDVSTILSHERSGWLIRVTTDPKAEKDWEEVYPIYTQSGLGAFCIPKVKIPQKYEGKTGIVSVVSAATDGLLYQCSMVKFVSGTGDNFSKCSNGSATGYFDTNDQLSALVSNSSDPGSSGGSSSSGTTTPTQSSSSSSASATQSAKDGAATSMQAWGFMSSLLTVAAMAVAGGAILA